MITVKVRDPLHNAPQEAAYLVAYYFWLIENVDPLCYKIEESAVNFENHEDALAFKMKFNLYKL